MSLGKAVIVSDYSATTEFCNKQSSIPIPCQKVAVRKEQIDHPCYLSVKEWAEPDIDAAASALLKLYNDPEMRNRIGNSAKAFIAEHFSSSNFKASVEKFLNE